MEDDFNIKLDGTTLNVYLGYELMNENAPALHNELKKYRGQNITKIVYDATDLVYISRSGIRVISYTFQELGKSPKIEFVNQNAKEGQGTPAAAARLFCSQQRCGDVPDETGTGRRVKTRAEQT